MTFAQTVVSLKNTSLKALPGKVLTLRFLERILPEMAPNLLIGHPILPVSGLHVLPLLLGQVCAEKIDAEKIRPEAAVQSALRYLFGTL